MLMSPFPDIGRSKMRPDTSYFAKTMRTGILTSYTTCFFSKSYLEWNGSFGEENRLSNVWWPYFTLYSCLLSLQIQSILAVCREATAKSFESAARQAQCIMCRQTRSASRVHTQSATWSGHMKSATITLGAREHAAREEQVLYICPSRHWLLFWRSAAFQATSLHSTRDNSTSSRISQKVHCRWGHVQPPRETRNPFPLPATRFNKRRCEMNHTDLSDGQHVGNGHERVLRWRTLHKRHTRPIAAMGFEMQIAWRRKNAVTMCAGSWWKISVPCRNKSKMS
jgi:hypothetical protein